MKDIQNLRCEQQQTSGRGVCRDTATFYVLGRSFSGEMFPELYCNRHASGFRRRQYTDNDLLLPLTDDIRAEVVGRHTAHNEREATINAEKAKQREAARLVRNVEQFEAAQIEWTHTMTVDVQPDPWDRENDRVEVQIHVHAVGTEINGWDHCEVAISETKDQPAVVKISGGSPMTISTNAAVALSTAIAMVAQMVNEINAQ